MGTLVELGSEMKGFEQFQVEDHVIVQTVRRSHGEESLEETQVPWLVGTDGAHSTVRKTLALSFPGETRDDEMVVGDIKVRAGLDDREVREIFIYNLAFILFLCRDGSDPQTCTV
jgi:2-polyprenyl-6-methoxyphenol hydroxylase-like FAD-dependent oxidoreductase